MFEKTSFLFKFFYFVTAVSPAVLLFSISIEISTIYLLSEVAIIVFSFIILRMILKKSAQDGGILQKIDNDLVVDKNGGSLSFIFGIIVPSVIIPDSVGTVTKICIFLVVQLLVFILMSKSSSIFPNVILIIFGINTYKLKSGKYVIDLNDIINNSVLKLNAKRIGSSSMCNTYVVWRDNGEN